ncbi:MAG: drug/metabolite exporter YedA [Myxococcota bacterium]|nr:drug/metabolite exporter YedA [Myxococcota bacterium]
MPARAAIDDGAAAAGRPGSHPASAPSSRVTMAFLAVCILWGSTFFGIRIALQSFPPFLIGALRFFCAGLLLFGVAYARHERPPRALEWAGAALTGSLYFIVGNCLVNLAEQWISSGLASVLVATMPLWASLFARLLGERLTRQEVVGILIGVAGVAVLNVGGELRASPVGALCGLLAPMGWALGFVLDRRVPAPVGMMRTAAQMLAGGGLAFALSYAAHERVTTSPSLKAVLAVVYLCLFGSVGGFSAYSYLMQHTRLAVATSYAYINPVIAVVLGVALAGEHFGAASLLGAIIVLGAVALVLRGRSGSAARPSVTLPRAQSRD